MRVSVNPEYEQEVYAGATDPQAKHEALSAYLAKDQPSGLIIKLSDEEKASLPEYTPDSVLAFARQKVGVNVDFSAGSPPPSLGTDLAARAILMKANAIKRGTLRKLPSEASEAKSEMVEIGLRAGVMPRVADKIDAATPTMEPGDKSTFEKSVDWVDAALSVPGALKLVSKGKAPLITAVARPMYSVLSANADVYSLVGMPAEKRDEWLSTVSDGHPARESYRKIVEGISEWEAKRDALELQGQGHRAGEVLQAVQKAKEGLIWQYFKPGNATDPYGGGAPRPWAEDSADAVDIVMRGALGFDSDDVSKYRPSVLALSSTLGMPVREIGSFIKSAPGLKDSFLAELTTQGVFPALTAVGLLAGGGGKASSWADAYQVQAKADRAEHIEGISKGKSVGMGFFNLALMASPDLALPGVASKAAQLVDTPIGKISRQAEASRQMDTLAHQSSVLEKAQELVGRALTKEEVAELSDRTESAVDVLYSVAQDVDKGVVIGLDTSGAVSVRNGPDGLRVVSDPSKVSVDVRQKRRLIDELITPVQNEQALFPADAPIMSAAKAAGNKFIGVLGDGEGELGVQLLTAAEAIRPANLGRPLVVRDTVTLNWRRPEATDLVGKSRMKLFRHFTGAKARANDNFLRAEVNDAVQAVRTGTDSPQQRIIVGKYVEVMGAPSTGGAIAGELWNAMHAKVDEGLNILPSVLKDLRAAEKVLEKEATVLADALRVSEQELILAERALAEGAPVAAGSSSLDDAVSMARKNRDDAYKKAASASNEAKAAKKAASGSDIVESARKAKRDAARAAARAEVDLRQAEEALSAGVKPGTEATSQVDPALLRARDEAADRLASARSAESAAVAAEREASEAYLRASDASLNAGPSTYSLGERVLREIDMQAKRSKILADVMEGMTGARTPEAFQARRDLAIELRAMQETAEAVASDAVLVKSLNDMTLGEAKQAERAWARASKNGFKNFDEFNSLPPSARAATESVREYLAATYRRMKASGKLGDKVTLAQFYEKNLVEGYITHMLSRAGRKALQSRLRQAGLGSSKWRTVIDATKERTRRGTIEEVNEAARTRVADMVRDDAIDMGATKMEAEALHAQWVDNLKDDIYFENDPLQILPRYAADTASGMANSAMVKDIINLFPEGERFAGVVKDIGLKNADRMAAVEGFKRVDGVTLLRTLDPELAMWHGWRTRADRIDDLMDMLTPESADRVLGELRALGAPIGESVSAGTRSEFGKVVYMPAMVADEMIALSKPSIWANMPDGIKQSLKEYTSVWKTMMTVVSAAFHGRNWVSNVLASAMSNGYHAVSPTTQIMAHQILLADPDKILTIGNTTMSAKEWRDAFRKGGVIADTLFLSGDKVASKGNVQVGRALKTGLVGGGAGAAYGAASADPDENKLARAFAFGGLGFGMAAGGSANFDMYGRDAVRAGGGWERALRDLKPTPAGKARWSARKEQVFRDMAEPMQKAGRVGVVNGLAGLIWGVGTGDPIGAASMAARGGGAAALVMEAAAIVGGAAGGHIEGMAKIGNAIAELKKGGSMSAAAKAANRATFDYASLTRVEREALRAVIPFYTWTSKNIALQADLMVNNPGAYNILAKTFNAFSYEGDSWAQPDYYAHRWLVGLGAGSLMAGMNTGPEAAVELLTKDWRGLASNMNPLPKALFERFLGESFFYKKPILQIDNGRDYESMPQWMKDKVGYREDLIDPKNPTRKLSPRIGWYEMTNEELLEASSGSLPFSRLQELEVESNPSGVKYLRDMKRGTHWHQMFASHPTRRVLQDFNKAMKDSFQSAFADEVGQNASAGERAGALFFGAKVTNQAPQDFEKLEEARRRHFSNKIDRSMESMFEQNQAYRSINPPAAYQAPAGKYLQEKP